MASKQSSAQVSEQDRFLLLRLRMAVAMAIIKSKPDGMSSREFTEKLASNLRKRNENWRKRAEDLEREVLMLRQELLLRRISTGRREETTEAEVQEVFSEDLFAPNKDTDQVMDSDSETPDLLMDISTNTYIQPTAWTATANITASAENTSAAEDATSAQLASGGCAAASVFRETTVKEPLPHVLFLQALCGLQPFTGPRPDPLLPVSAPEGGPVLEETLSRLLRSVCAAFRASAGGRAPEGLMPSRGALLWACEVVVSALDVHCSCLSPSLSFCRTLEELMRGLSHTLLSSGPQHQLSDSVLDGVLVLGRSRLLLCVLIRQILCDLISVVDKLWALHQASEPELSDFPLEPFENSCRLMWLLQRLLQVPNSNAPIREALSSNWPITDNLCSNRPITEDQNPNNPIREDCSLNRPTVNSQGFDRPMRSSCDSNEPMRAGSGLNRPIPVDLSSIGGALEDLQRRVFPLSQEFPLFTVCLWRVLGLVANGNETEDE